MILLFGAVLLLFHTDARFINRLRPHLVDNIKLKCESLPYRSVYDQNKCYFAVFRKVASNDSPNECSTILKNSKVAWNAPSEALEALQIDRSKFHGDEEAIEEKHTLCVYESGYKCDKGQTMIRNKCGTRAAKKMTYAEAQKSCKKQDMDLLSPVNDMENQIILRELSKTPAWTQKSLESRGGKFKWAIGERYARFTTCDGKAKKLYGGSQTPCNAPLTAVVDTTGYWSNADQKNEFDVICTKRVGNDFTPAVVKKKPIIEKEGACPEQHEKDDSTGKCEWTGPIDACAQLVTYWNKSHFVTIPDFPENVHREECLRTTRKLIDEYTVKVIVRRGCMFTGYTYPLDGSVAWQEVKVAENLLYGVHKLPNFMSGNFSAQYEGLTRANCFCDPTEATLNGHVPEPPPDRKCIEYHEFNEDTQQCEWTLPAKFCGEIITDDNRRMRLEMPNWPEKRKYDVNHWAAKRWENFHVTVTRMIVRQHCFATAYFNNFHEFKTLPTMGYGNYTVASSTNGLVTAGYGGSSRFVCECIR